MGLTSEATLRLKSGHSPTTTNPCILSGKLEGSITFHQKGWYTFECHFHNTSTGWVWVDGHVVCGDDNAYQPPILDNPLKIPATTSSRQNRKKFTFPFRAHVTANTTAHCHDNDDDENEVAPTPYLQVFWKREPFDESATEAPTRFQIMRHSSLIKSTRGHATFNATRNSPIAATFHPELSDPEHYREILQGYLKQGWGYWLRSNILSIVKLPEGLVVSFQICSMGNSSKCLDTAVPDTQGVRVDLHAYDRSYVSYNISYMGMDLQIECSITGEEHREQLEYLITVHYHNGKDDFLLSIAPRYAWFRPGSISSSSSGFLFDTPGLG
ncbi:MAG: hypothetical protein SGILL_005632, partial [Bacillariaceae sp.]